MTQQLGSAIALLRLNMSFLTPELCSAKGNIGMTLPAVQEVPDLDLKPTIACKEVLHDTQCRLCSSTVC